ncbi:MAG: DNA alkylation repair protein [Candidatus Kapaibacterium sp.]
MKKMSSPQRREGMKHFAVGGANALGVTMKQLNPYASKIGKNHELALELWATGIHEARILAALIDRPSEVTPGQMDRWAQDFDSWDICDQCCMKLFDKTPFIYDKIFEWARSDREFVRRAAFASIAALAVHDKKAPDEKMEQFFPLIMEYSTDERNFVRKAVNWALRQIGKRNAALMDKAIALSHRIIRKKGESKSARWIARDAIRELELKKAKF